MEKIVASIQVRMGSSRYPGKVMHEISGKPLLRHLVDRVRKSKLLDDIVVATSLNKENDIIVDYCIKHKIPFFRGDENDVLGRTLGALKEMKATIGVEVFGDCPLIDPKVVDMIIKLFLDDDSDPDFVGNDMKTTFPPGMDVEVFKVNALKDSDLRITDPSIREHGTLFIRQNPDIYKIKNIVAPPKWNRPELELEVDTPEDMVVITSILDFFEKKGIDNFDLNQIIAFMDDNPDIKNLNKNVPRRWKELRGEE